MEQVPNLSGFNWQIYYKNVLKGNSHTRATIYVVVKEIGKVEEILNLANKNQQINWVIDSSNIENPWIMVSLAMNVLFIDWSKLPEKEKVEYWKNIDYIWNDEDDYSINLPAMLSGVELIRSEDIPEVLRKDFSLRDQSLERINSFEKGKAILDIFLK